MFILIGIDGDDEELILKPLWEREDLTTLVENITKQLPIKDALNYKKTLEKINWDKVSFGTYSAYDCKNQAALALNKV